MLIDGRLNRQVSIVKSPFCKKQIVRGVSCKIDYRHSSTNKIP